MKKFLTVVVLFAALMTAVPAKAEVKFGLKGGLNLTNMRFDSSVADSVSTLLRFMISVLLRLEMKKSSSSLFRFLSTSVMALVSEAQPASISSLVLSLDLMLAIRALHHLMRLLLPLLVGP